MTIHNKATAFTISFPMIDSANRPSRKSGLVFGSGNTQISKDGGVFANTTNNASEIDSSGRYSLALTASEMNADHVHVIATGVSGADDVDLVYATSGHPSGTVVTNGGNTSSSFATSLTDTAADTWKDSLILFTTGTLIGQVKRIGSYTVTNGVIGLSTGQAFTSTPSSGDRFLLIDF